MSDTATLTAALREAADLLDQHPDLPHLPYITSSSDGSVHLAWFLTLPHLSGDDLTRQKSDARDIVRTVGGKWDKDETIDDFRFRQSRSRLRLDVQVARPAVCERVVVGTETRTIPAVEARAERVETVEKVEWRCQPLLADDHAEQGDDTTPAETYECQHCDAKLGIAGEHSGSEEDFAADDYFRSEIERHESGACVRTEATR